MRCRDKHAGLVEADTLLDVLVEVAVADGALGSFELLALLALLRQHLEVDLIRTRVVVQLHEGLHVRVEALLVLEHVRGVLCLLRVQEEADVLVDLLLEALVQEVPQIVVRLLQVLLVARSDVRPVALLGDLVEGAVDQLVGCLVDRDVGGQEVDVLGDGGLVECLLVAQLEEVDLALLGAQVDRVVLQDLVLALQRVAHQVEEFVVEHVRVGHLAGLGSVKLASPEQRLLAVSLGPAEPPHGLCLGAPHGSRILTSPVEVIPD